MPSEFLTIKAAYLMKKEYVKDILSKRLPCFCGWLYSKNSFNLFWDGYYTVESEEPIGDLTGFNLTIK